MSYKSNSMKMKKFWKILRFVSFFIWNTLYNISMKNLNALYTRKHTFEIQFFSRKYHLNSQLIQNFDQTFQYNFSFFISIFFNWIQAVHTHTHRHTLNSIFLDSLGLSVNAVYYKMVNKKSNEKNKVRLSIFSFSIVY